MLGLKQKSIDCLTISATRHDLGTRLEQRLSIADMLYRRACRLYSEKAVDRKFEELADRGYIGYGVSARTGWLTAKGRKALIGALVGSTNKGENDKK